MNWFDAQQYCREHYTDLATVSSLEDLMRLEEPANSLKTSRLEPWAYQSWAMTNLITLHHTIGVYPSCLDCGRMLAVKEQSSQLGTKKYTMIETGMNWTQAQSYCRQHYTDLAVIEMRLKQ
ncbi:hypothetical protein WMY93_030855 [Mugilogobius chulae]|uniref:C-type lectin domain-containing protein n=1 Tax=Mugilogobius chulae TaxID=88201 RepID=A0AAW0MQD1_9GOBI